MILLESLEAIGSSTFFAWLMDQLRAIAALRVPVLTAIMSVLTYLGHEMGFLVVGMIIMWCINKRYGYRFLGIFMLGSFLQQALKAAFMIPRPWIIDPTFQAVANAIPAASGYSFPSGHTLTACITLGGLAMLIKKKWAYACALILTLLVAFSRMYLGVHTLLDVSVGFLLGVLVLVFFGLMFRNEGEQKGKLNAVLCISSAACIGLLVYLLMSPLPANPAFHPMAKESIANAYVLVGASVGMLVGKFMDDTFVHFETEASIGAQILKVLIGLVIALAVRTGLKKLFGGENETALLHGLRYFFLTVVCIGVYPLLFKVLNKIGAKKA